MKNSGVLDPVDHLPLGFLEFADVVSSFNGQICGFVNFQKRELAFINFVARSQSARNKFKVVFPNHDNYQYFAMDYGLKLGMKKYGSQLLTLIIEEYSTSQTVFGSSSFLI